MTKEEVIKSVEKIKENVLKVTKAEESYGFYSREDIEKEIAECQATITRNQAWLVKLDTL